MDRNKNKHDVDWGAIETEYVTGHMSYRDLAAKHGVSSSTIFKVGKRGGWPAKRKKHQSKVVAKAVRKAETKQANLLAKELTLLNRIEKHLDKALKDEKQFNRHLVQYGVEGVSNTEERIYEKMDMRALKDAMSIAREAEKMRRSIMGVLTASEQEQLDLARKRLDLETKKTEAVLPGNVDKEVHVRFSEDAEEWSG